MIALQAYVALVLVAVASASRHHQHHARNAPLRLESTAIERRSLQADLVSHGADSLWPRSIETLAPVLMYRRDSKKDESNPGGKDGFPGPGSKDSTDKSSKKKSSGKNATGTTPGGKNPMGGQQDPQTQDKGGKPKGGQQNPSGPQTQGKGNKDEKCSQNGGYGCENGKYMDPGADKNGQGGQQGKPTFKDKSLDGLSDQDVENKLKQSCYDYQDKHAPDYTPGHTSYLNGNKDTPDKLASFGGGRIPGTSGSSSVYAASCGITKVTDPKFYTTDSLIEQKKYIQHPDKGDSFNLGWVNSMSGVQSAPKGSGSLCKGKN